VWILSAILAGSLSGWEFKVDLEFNSLGVAASAILVFPETLLRIV
jgi:hypothetical protein